mmetsp:Transcript_27347/g.42466  ORF Transcript_27347/g.42466 Transcript_27347/m.42466 type:complete len:288 (+) Transcript_27347:964-1827(+)
MQIPLVREVLSGSQSETRGNDTLNSGIIGQVQKESRTLHGTRFLEIRAEETSSLHVDTHGSKDNGKVLLVTIHGVLLLNQRGLTGNLGSDLIVGKTSCGENGNLLTTSNGVHDINGRDTSLNHSLGVITTGRVNGLSVDVQIRLRQNFGGIVNHFTATIETATKHLLGNAHFQNISREFALSLAVINARSALKHLDNSTVSSHLQHLSRAGGAISEGQVDNFGEFGELHVVQDYQGSIYTCDRAVLQSRLCSIVLYYSELIKFNSGRDEAFLVGHGCLSIYWMLDVQ